MYAEYRHRLLAVVLHNEDLNPTKASPFYAVNTLLKLCQQWRKFSLSILPTILQVSGYRNSKQLSNSFSPFLYTYCSH